MQVLVATRQTQGSRSDDFSWTVEGELVRFPFDACDCPDCGCDRSFAGLASSKATTTARVADRPDLTAEQYTTALRDALVRQGFVAVGDPADEDFVDDLAARQLAAAAALPSDGVVEIGGGRLQVRPQSVLDG